MPAGDSPDVLVARFLRANNYKETFEAFVRETNLSPSSITNNPTDLTIEKILQEKKLYDLAVRFEKIEIDAGDVDFSVPHPSVPTTLTTASTTSNILSINLSSLILPSSSSSSSDAGSAEDVIIATSSDKALRIYSSSAPHALLSTLKDLHAGPILCVLPVEQRWLITASMAGDIAISNTSGEVLQKAQGHTKYIVKLALSEPLSSSSDAEEEVRYLAAASYDKSLSVHALHIPKVAAGEEQPPPPRLEFLQKFQFPQTVEDVIFSKDYRPESQGGKGSQIMIATHRDSPHLHIFSHEPSESTTTATDFTAVPHLALASKTSLNATATTWLNYTPTSLAPHPHQPHLLALITSSLPAPKILVFNLSTMAVDKEFQVPVELSAYSTGIITWRKDENASGLWVNGDNGMIKGVEVKSGAVKAELKGHPGRKVRCLATGSFEGGELLASGGFDGGLKIWRIEQSGEAV